MPVKVVIKANGFTANEVKPFVAGKALKVNFSAIAKSQSEWLTTGIIGLLGKAKVGPKEVNLKIAGKNMTITELPADPGSHEVDVYVGTTLAGKITTNFAGAAPKEEVVLPDPVLSWENGKVESACSGVLTKIHSIYHAGKGYKGHGPVALLGNANHAHVTNDDGVAFRWKGDTLHIVSHGIKSDKGGVGSCGYIWVR